QAQRGSRPVDSRPAHRLADPRREVREVFRHPPGPGSGTFVEPCELIECKPLLVAKRGGGLALARFQQDDREAFLAELVSKSAAAGARTNNHDHRVIIRCIGSHCSLLKPAWGWRIREGREARSGR